MYAAIINIHDSVLQIIAFSIVFDMKDPSIFNKKQRDKAQCKMIDQLQSLLQNRSLLVSTLLFVRCYSIHHLFPVPFKHMANIIGVKLNKTSENNPSEVQEAAYIALRQLNNLDLLHYLSNFGKKTKNLSDLLNFNSTIFFRYYTNATSFGLSNVALLSIMYLTELAFDAQILNMYNNDNQTSEVSPFEQLNQLWLTLSKRERIMTFETATHITNYLSIWNEQDLYQIINDVSNCSIENKALLVVEKWLMYRMNERLRNFAYCAALQLTIAGKTIRNFIDIISELMEFDREYCFGYLFTSLLNSKLVKLHTISKIILALHRNTRYSSIMHILIDRKNVLKLILKLELERIHSNVHSPSETSYRPLVLLIIIDSEKLQFYLLKIST